ncbi:MAG: hypothetical protein JNM56_24165 [Planctomycetia bacterium]|nr:hypothetical protein [Planctomycetia bacterium]
MSSLSWCVLLTCLPCATAPAMPRADLPHGPVDAPVVGRPNHFWEAVGKKFDVSMRISPPRPEMYVGQSLTLTVRVTAQGPYRRPPERPRLDEIPKFTERFKIGRTAGPQPDRTLTDQRAWEFDYRLSPVNDKVERIPPLPFVWYRPARSPGQRGDFQTTYHDGIDIVVKPLPPETPPPPKPIQAPEQIFQIAEGPKVLRNAEPFRLPPPLTLVLLLLAPPVIVLAGCRVWKRLYPDAARLACKRQSRAALEALNALKKLDGATGLPRVERVAGIAGHYLRQRLDLPSAEPTPAEVALHLRTAGAKEEIAEQAADFFRKCDALRYGPRQPDAAAEDCAAIVQQLIAKLEAEPWSPRS